MEQKTCRIAPYEKERWDWLLSAVLIPFMLMCFCMNTDWELPWWVYVGVLILACLGFGKARIRQRGVELFLSDKGIRVCNGGQETVGLTPWSAFDASYILSIVYVFFGDIKYLYDILLTLWMYLSAIFYPASALPEVMQKIVGMNPIYVSITFARICVIDRRIPEFTLWIKLIAFGLCSFSIGYMVFKKNQNKVMQKI